MFGYSDEDLALGFTVSDVIAAADRARAWESFNDLLASSEQLRGHEYTAVRKDGTTLPVFINSSRQIRNGEVCGILGILVNMTDAKRDEQERQKLQSQLLHAHRMESIGTLAGGIAHDFNNLLGGIMGGLSLMELDLSDTQGLQEELQEMKVLVDRGAALTKQLLGFARRGKYAPRALDVNEAVTRNAKMFGRTRKDIVLCLDCTSAVPAVVADDAQLDQVLLNLLLNAGQAMPSSGLLTLRTLAVDVSATDASIHGTEPGRYVRIVVQDTGAGMTADTMAHIFEPFFTTKERGRGTGLGLASVYGIVTNHGGFITVESEVGKGSTFCVNLPAVQAPVETSQAESALLRTGSETLLLVDDEEQIVRTTGKLLRAMGYEVLVARSGAEAVEVFRPNQPKIALVILDMIMPGMSGLQTFNALRELSPTLKVLLCSGHGAEGQASEILERGCNGFIQKPFDSAALSAKLTELLW